MSTNSTAAPTIPRLVTIDRSSPIPLYYQVAEQLKRAVESGEITPGTRLANEVELADHLGVSRPTMRKAMEQLVSEGLVVRQRGAGTRVVSPKVLRYLELTSLYDDLHQSGQRPTTSVLSNTVEGATPEVAEALGVEPGTPVIAIVRLRSANDQPIAILTNYLPAHRLMLTTEELETHGLYQLMRRAGIVLHSATQVIGARTATTAEARLLGERRGDALLTMQRTVFDDRRAVVEYGNHLYYAARYSFEMSMPTR